MADLVDHWRVTADGWEPGVERLTWLIAFGDCAGLTRAAAELDPPSWLDPVEPRWLHMTVSDEETVPHVGPFVLEFDRIELWPTGVMVVPRPCRELEVLGVERPHVSLAYVNGEGEVDPEAVLPHFEPCVAHAERVERVRLRRHGRRYTWDPARRDPNDRSA